MGVLKHSKRNVLEWVFCYFIYIYIYICVCVCVCVLFMLKLKRKKEKKLNVLICIEFGSYFKKYQKIFFLLVSGL